MIGGVCVAALTVNVDPQDEPVEEEEDFVLGTGEEGWNRLLEHRDNLGMFALLMEDIFADEQVDSDELTAVCAAESDWERLLTEAGEYATAYRDTDPIVAYSNIEMIEAMEKAAPLSLDLLRGMECP